MRIPLTKYGWPQVVLYPLGILTGMIALALTPKTVFPPWVVVAMEVAPGAVLVWSLSFFRDPERSCPSDRNILLAPADGTITNIDEVEEDNFIRGKAIRIGIFLSIFSTHINRAPCNVKVERILYGKGRFESARNPHSGRVNESNDLALVRTDAPRDRLLVRQVSGAIAQRIVCAVAEGQELAGGERFGMIKFGSRTELYLPVRKEARCLVEIGDKVKAGLTALVRYEQCQD